jgi:hypothetical protein
VVEEEAQQGISPHTAVAFYLHALGLTLHRAAHTLQAGLLLGQSRGRCRAAPAPTKMKNARSKSWAAFSSVSGGPASKPGELWPATAMKTLLRRTPAGTPGSGYGKGSARTEA